MMDENKAIFFVPFCATAVIIAPIIGSIIIVESRGTELVSIFISRAINELPDYKPGWQGFRIP